LPLARYDTKLNCRQNGRNDNHSNDAGAGESPAAPPTINKEDEMKFSEAMELIKEGSKVTRYPWKETTYFLMVDKERKQIQSYQPKICPYIYDESIMISDGWVLDKAKGDFLFPDIIHHLIRGDNARLKEWQETFIYFEPSIKGLAIHSMEPFPFVPDFESFSATDWIEIDGN
jgi:hypothetical protein